MSSEHSSTRSSLQTEDLSKPPFSKTVPESPAKFAKKPVFFTEPESPCNNRPASAEHVLDIEILTHKLQLHQLELEQALLKQKQRRAAKEQTLLMGIPPSSPIQFHRPLNPASFNRKQEPWQAAVPSLATPNQMNRQPNKIVKDGDIFGSLQTRSQGKALRARRPAPLDLLGTQTVTPQVVQSATLPQARPRPLAKDDSSKQNWRRMTISAGKNSTLIMMSSPGEMKELSFVVPPVPTSSGVTLPTSLVPDLGCETPLNNEDRIRRDLEAFALEESTDLRLSRRASALSRRHINGAYVPDRSQQVSPPPPLKEERAQSPLVNQIAYGTTTSTSPQIDGLKRKKSFFERFERKTKVDDVLDMYMTQEQLDQEKASKLKLSRSKRQGMFRMWPYSDRDTMPEMPG